MTTTHTRKLTTQWLKQHDPGLNPNEYLWDDLKIGVHQQSASNQSELEQFCKKMRQMLHSIDVKWYENYPSSLKAAIKAKGDSVKY